MWDTKRPISENLKAYNSELRVPEFEKRDYLFEEIDDPDWISRLKGAAPNASIDQLIYEKMIILSLYNETGCQSRHTNVREALAIIDGAIYNICNNVGLSGHLTPTYCQQIASFFINGAKGGGV